MGSFMTRNNIAAMTGVYMACMVCTAQAEYTNLIRNGSFEEVADSGVHTDAKFWKLNHPDMHGDQWGSASRENWRAFEGEYIGTIRGLWADCGTYGGWWQEVEAVPGANYRFSGWFYSDPEWIASTQEIKIEFWDKNHTTVLHSRTKKISDCDMDWAEVSIEAVAPTGAAWTRVVVNVINTGASGSLQMDNLELVNINLIK